MKTTTRALLSILTGLVAAAPAFAGPPTMDDCEAPPPTGKEWRYQVQLPIRFGYESNALGLSDDVLRPKGINHRSSVFTEINPSLTVTYQADEATAFTFRYDLDKFYYQQQADINSTLHSFGLSGERIMGASILSFASTYAHVLTDEEGTLDKFVAGPTVQQKWSDRERGIFSYNFIVNEFLLPNNAKVLAVRDNDSVVHLVSVGHKHFIREECAAKGDPGFAVTLTYQHTWEQADGADFDKQRNRVKLAFAGQLWGPDYKALHPFGVQADYTHDFDDYANPNSRAGASGFAFARNDNIDELNATINHPIDFHQVWKGGKAIASSAFVTYHYDRRDSNIIGFDRDDHRISFGITGSF